MNNTYKGLLKLGWNQYVKAGPSNVAYHQIMLASLSHVLQQANDETGEPTQSKEQTIVLSQYLPQVERNWQTSNSFKTLWWRGPVSNFLNILDNWEKYRTNQSEISSSKKFCQMKWPSILIWFVLSWNTEFLALCIIAWLSEWRSTNNDIEMKRSCKRKTNHVSSATTRLIEWYSASMELRETEVCLFDFQEIGETSSDK